MCNEDPSEINRIRYCPKIKIGVVCLFGVLTLLAVFLFLQEKRHKSSMRNFQNIETTARQIITIIEAHYSDRDRYPSSSDDFYKIISDYDPLVAASIQGHETRAEYRPAGPDQVFSFLLWRKDRPEFRYVCSADHACNWSPHLPYP